MIIAYLINKWSWFIFFFVQKARWINCLLCTRWQKNHTFSHGRLVSGWGQTPWSRETRGPGNTSQEEREQGQKRLERCMKFWILDWQENGSNFKGLNLEQTCVFCFILSIQQRKKCSLKRVTLSNKSDLFAKPSNAGVFHSFTKIDNILSTRCFHPGTTHREAAFSLCKWRKVSVASVVWLHKWKANVGVATPPPCPLASSAAFVGLALVNEIAWENRVEWVCCLLAFSNLRPPIVAFTNNLFDKPPVLPICSPRLPFYCKTWAQNLQNYRWQRQHGAGRNLECKVLWWLSEGF